MKKVLNICSYALNVIFVVLFIWGYFSTRPKTTNEQGIEFIKCGIVEKERAELPLRVQQFEHVYAITIDSMVVTNDVEPYSAYLVTTWDIDERQKLTSNQWAANGYKDKYIRKEKTVYVQVRNIITENGAIKWNAGWHSAYYEVKDGDK